MSSNGTTQLETNENIAIQLIPSGEGKSSIIRHFNTRVISENKEMINIVNIITYLPSEVILFLEIQNNSPKRHMMIPSIDLITKASYIYIVCIQSISYFGDI